MVKIVNEVGNFKTCNRCKESKLKENFCKSSKSPDGYQYKCKSCETEINVERCNKEKIKVTTKTCSKCKLEKDSALFSKNSSSKDGLRPDCNECKKDRRLKNKEKELELARIYYQTNKEKVNNYRRITNAKRRKEDPFYKLRLNYRSLIRSSFNQHSIGKVIKRSKSIDILGCSFDTYLNSMELQFLDWMSWENHGRCMNSSTKCTWNFDHIIPISYAKTEEELYLLNHWSNFQPMCSSLNRSKSSTIYPCTNLELRITFWEDRWEYLDQI